MKWHHTLQKLRSNESSGGIKTKTAIPFKNYREWIDKNATE